MLRCRIHFRPVIRRRVLALGLCLLPSILAVAGQAQWETNHYEVTGATLEEIKRSMIRNRPPQVSREALTEWHIRTRFSTAQFQGGYRCNGFTTLTCIRVTLPGWTPSEGVPEEVRDEWNRYISALTKHEVGHGRIAMAAADELRRRVAAVETAPDPDQLESTVEQLVRQTLEEFRERDREYDRLTHHGLKQGATLAVKTRDRGGRRRPSHP